MSGRLVRLAVGAGVLTLTVPVLAGCDPDLSGYCGGAGNMPYECAAKLLGGTPVPANSSNSLRVMSRPNQPAPSPSERDACVSAAAVIYQVGDSRRDRAIDGCQSLLHGVHWWDLSSQTRVS